ncbi:hypothetical protein HF521_007501 [Silurus meridionalis]|uniref:SRCR domain-containing protein n=1 Tax=Silurus meridionalis TaxID=175797 RepID=A0A8T0ARS2_SILME|nr:hypothetical protein HF521_007501 [Silurus meridionalis]
MTEKLCLMDFNSAGDETSLHPRGTHGSKHWSLRLSGGKGSCSGRLEVYHNATWGSVCDDQWNISNAQVVCRQLGCGSVLSADRFGPGEGTVWLNRVKCRGDEIHLWDCHHSLKKHTDCSHAGVTCAGLYVFRFFRTPISCTGCAFPFSASWISYASPQAYLGLSLPKDCRVCVCVCVCVCVRVCLCISLPHSRH